MFFPWQFQLTFVRFLTGENKTNNSKNITLHLFSEQQFWMSLKWLLNDVTINALKQAPNLCVTSNVGLISSGGDIIINHKQIVLVGSYYLASRGLGFGKQCISMAFTERRLGKWQWQGPLHYRAFLCCSQGLQATHSQVFVACAASLLHRCWERLHPTTSDLMSINRNQKFLLP